MKPVNIEFVRVSFHCPAGVDEFRPCVGVVLFDDFLVDGFGQIVDEVGEFNVQTGLAVHAGITPALGRLFAARARNRRKGFGLFSFNVEAVGARNLTVAGVLKDRDVARGDAATARPSVMLFEDGLVDAARGEITGRGLSEVRERDGLVDASLVSSAPEDLSIQLVTDSAGIVELRPQRRTRVLTRGVVFEPLLKVRDARDEWDGPLAGLSVDGDLETVVVVRNVPEGEVSELPGARAGIPRHGDHSLATVVTGGFNHRQHVFVPVEHVAGVRRGLIVARRARGHPLNTVGDVVAVGGVLGEHAEGDAIVPVRLLVVIFLVNPADDGLGRIAIVKGVGKTADLLADTDAPSQQVFVAVVAVARGQQEHPVGEGHERIGVGVREIGSGLDALPETFDALARFFRHANQSYTRCDVNPRCESPTEHYPDGLITGSNRQTAAASGGGAA